MKIERVLTNNAVVVKSETGNYQIVCGKGIAFKKRSQDEIDTSLINQRYVSIPDSSLSSQLESLLADIPVEYVLISDEIMKMATSELGLSLNESLLIALADHIYESVKRYHNDLNLPNGLRWEIKRFYQKEYAVAEKARQMINARFGVELPEDEAAYLTMHLLNACAEEASLHETVKMTKLIQDILQIIRIHFRVLFDEDSGYYYRFITHLKYFTKRVVMGSVSVDTDDSDLSGIIFEKYPEAAACTKKIAQFIYSVYNYKMGREEAMFLTIHIQTLLRKAAQRTH